MCDDHDFCPWTMQTSRMEMQRKRSDATNDLIHDSTITYQHHPVDDPNLYQAPRVTVDQHHPVAFFNHHPTTDHNLTSAELLATVADVKTTPKAQEEDGLVPLAREAITPSFHFSFLYAHVSC